MAKVLLLGSFSKSLLAFRGHFIRRLIEEDHDVVAAAPSMDEEVAETLRQWGARSHEVPMERTGVNPVQDLQTLWALHRLFEWEKPDIFLGYTIKPVVYGLLAAWLADVPSRYALITGVGTAFTDGAGKKQYMLQIVASMLYRLSLSKCHRAIFQNPDDAYLFCARRLVGGPEQVALVNGSGVDLDAYQPAPLPEEPSYLMISRLLRNKGVVEYVQAARRIKRLHPRARFRLVGGLDEGPAAISAREVEEWICDGYVEYLGYMDDVRPALADANVYVLPSYREGTPRTVLEAMAMGRPVVTTDVAGCRQTVEPGENGFLVPPRDVEALVRGMTHFIGEPDMVQTMGRKSREIARERFDVEEVTEGLMRMLELRGEVEAKRGGAEARK